MDKEIDYQLWFELWFDLTLSLDLWHENVYFCTQYTSILNSTVLIKKLAYKVHIFWEGQKVLRNINLNFDWHYIGQNLMHVIILQSTKLKATLASLSIVQGVGLCFGIIMCFESAKNSAWNSASANCRKTCVLYRSFM